MAKTPKLKAVRNGNFKIMEKHSLSNSFLQISGVAESELQSSFLKKNSQKTLI